MTKEQEVTKNEIVAQLVATGMSVEEATAIYEKDFTTGNSNASLPFPRVQVNNVAAGIADVGALVGDAQKDEDGEVISYGLNFNFDDIDVLFINRKAMFNVYDQETRRTTVKTKLMDTFTSKATFIDTISGKSIQQLVDEGVDCKYQMLATIAVRPKGSDEPFVPYSIYLKGSVLYGFNQACDALRESTPYQLLNIKTKIDKKGAVRFASIDLDNTEARALTKDELLGNLSFIMDANTKFNEYVEAINKQYDASSNEQTTEEQLPA